jgi:hypothetical protein
MWRGVGFLVSVCDRRLALTHDQNARWWLSPFTVGDG